MSRLLGRTLVVLSLVWLSFPALGYVERVHARITRHAFARAQGDRDFLKTLGVRPDQVFGGPTRFGPANALNLARKGSEDQDHAWNGLSVANHFYDPQVNRGLMAPPDTCVELGFKSPDWALGQAAGNTHDLPHVREHLRMAILGSTPSTRAENYRALFEGLGHIVHLVQDAAQPEHTRNDQHLPRQVFPRFHDWWSTLGFSDDPVDSYYETWTDQWLGLDGGSMPDGTDSETYFLGYPTVRLPDYRAYFSSTGHKGLADFSSRNFVTQDTNYHDELDHSRCALHQSPQLPDQHREILVAHRLLDPVDGQPYIDEAIERIYRSHPRDGYLGRDETDEYHTVLSSIDLEAQRRTTHSVFSLSDSSYQTRAAMLLPRAVGYSAGLIEHFFRGNIETKWERTGEGPVFSYRLTLKNLSTEPIGADARISAVYTATPAYFGRTGPEDTGTIFTNAELSFLAPGFSGLAPGSSVSFVVPQVFGLRPGDSLLDFERRVVITGTLGSEVGAVIPSVSNADTRPGIRFQWQPGAVIAFSVNAYTADDLWMRGVIWTDGRPDQNRDCYFCSVQVDAQAGTGTLRFNYQPKSDPPGSYWIFAIIVCCGDQTVTVEKLQGSTVIGTQRLTVSFPVGVWWF